MTEQWQELKETITEMRDNGGTGTQQEVCKFLANYMETLEKQMQEPCEDAVSRTLVHEAITASIAESENPYEMWQRIEALPSVTPQTVTDFTDKCRECGKIQNELAEDAVSREEVLNALDRVGNLKMYENCDLFAEHYAEYVRALPSVKPKYTDEEIDRAQAVEQAYVDKMVELAVEKTKRPKGKWITIQSGDKDFPESIVCSRCKNENSHLDFDEHSEPIGKIFVTSKYCPNCGAEMSGGGEE